MVYLKGNEHFIELLEEVFRIVSIRFYKTCVYRHEDHGEICKKELEVWVVFKKD